MKALSSMATRHLLADLADTAARASLQRLEVESVGGVDAAARVAAGEQVDLVFLADDALARLAAAGHVVAETVTPLVVSRVVAAVADPGAPPAAAVEEPAFSDAEALRQAMRAASRIGYSTGPSGDALLGYIDEWGMRDELTLVQARPGVPVAALLVAGEVDLGFQQQSELVGQPGIRILGPLPADSAVETVFAGAVATAAGDQAASAALLAFFAGPACDAVKAAHSFAVPA